MAKAKSIYACQECGATTSKWMGRCASCNSWNTIVEEHSVSKMTKSSTSLLPLTLHEIADDGATRRATGIHELDRVLGGGIVEGSLILIGGEPGIGKSTLLLQVCRELCKCGKVLYISGEESEAQIKMRALRLNIESDNLLIAGATDIEDILHVSENMKPCNLIIDSIQTMYCPEVSSAPGSVTQVRETTLKLMKLAKQTGIGIFVVGHVTKDGAIAGPRVLEHMVDCVLYFEGERYQSLRALRAVKNRFGSTNEIGVFQMTNEGLLDIENPSEMLLSGRPSNVSGSSIACAMEGTRPILVEIQALITQTAFGTPRRMAIGLDYNRVVLLMAIMEKWLGVNLGSFDAYVSVVGGLRLEETTLDLPIAAAILSSLRNQPLEADIVYMGEVGLTGELRSIINAEKRVAEIARLGFKMCVLPETNRLKSTNLETYYAKTLQHALSL